jgi:hypothetical protein
MEARRAMPVKKSAGSPIITNATARHPDCVLCKSWPRAVAIGARGVALTCAELLGQEIVPCFPNIDIGFDLVSVYGNTLKRIQVKATESTRQTRSAASFCLARHKTGHQRNGVYTKTPHRAYTHDDVDVFVFVHNILQLFYVVPAREINLARHKITFRPDSRWASAWDVLKQP